MRLLVYSSLARLWDLFLMKKYVKPPAAPNAANITIIIVMVTQVCILYSNHIFFIYYFV